MNKTKSLVLSDDSIKERIFLIRGAQVMLDRDLARLYKIETRALKQAINRNKKRFPSDFMFVLNESEVDVMVSQNVIPSKMHLGGSLPYAFTEQGIANLSSILNSDKAIEINIQIIRAFVEMRRFIYSNAQVFQRLESVEKKQIEYDEKLDEIFDALQDKIPEKGIFFDGQVFDAYVFVSSLIRSASKSIILIDNYIDDSVLTLFSKTNVSVIIYTNNITKQLELDLHKYNSQYSNILIKKFEYSHDGFLIIDNKLYHFGASLKDLGKKWFAFSKFDKDVFKVIERLKREKFSKI